MTPKPPCPRLGAALALVLSFAPITAVISADGPDLSWLAGLWCSGEGENRGVEVWLPEAGGQMLGVARTLRGGRVVSFEYMRIEADDRGLVYRAQPGGRPATDFRLADSGEGWVRFENPEHDFPRRIDYRRQGDELQAEIAGPGRDGQERRIPFAWSRCGELL